MADWIAEVDRLDKLLHSEGVPDRVRMRVVSQYADSLAQADKAKRDAEAARAMLKQTATLCRAMGATEAAKELGISDRTARWRRGQWLKVGNGTA